MTQFHDAAAYGRHIAQDYDAVYDGVFDTEAAVSRLRDLAEGGPVLEFGVGTGRLAIPLAGSGVVVHGVDGSRDMLNLMAEKPGGEQVGTTVGDFSLARVPGEFGLVVCATNTLFALPDQQAQLRCFSNAASHLRPGGRFVIEAWVPRLGPASGPTLEPRELAAGYVGLVIAEHNPIRQLLSTIQVVLGGPDGVRVFPVVHRYAHPAELDLMGQINGFVLEDRWADWLGEPLTATSANHVSVYRRLG
jgi:SAM-dependent methyltransferase